MGPEVRRERMVGQEREEGGGRKEERDKEWRDWRIGEERGLEERGVDGKVDKKGKERKGEGRGKEREELTRLCRARGQWLGSV